MCSPELGQPGKIASDAQSRENNKYLEQVIDELSQERLKKYYSRVGIGNNDLVLKLYRWNHDVGAALNASLQQVEVCLRNRVAIALRDKFGCEWFRSPKMHGHKADLRRLMQKAQDKADENRNGFHVSEGDFIAASSLGLWRELCQPEYASLFWHQRLKLSFPNYEAKEKDTRSDLKPIHDRVQRLSKLRNRIAHHEHVLGSYKERPGQMLLDRHRDMRELLGWMSAAFSEWVFSTDRLTATIQQCPISHADLV